MTAQMQHREDFQPCFLQEDQARLQISGDQEKGSFPFVISQETAQQSQY